MCLCNFANEIKHPKESYAMSLITIQTRHLSILSIAAVLTACGGGTTTPVVSSGNDLSDKYVGNWKQCTPYKVPVNSFLAYSSTLAITKIGANSYQTVAGNNDHTDASCTSAAVVIQGENGTTVYTITGTKMIGSTTVDTVTYPTGGSTVAKNLAYVNTAGPTLQLGATGSGNDANGYPNALETNRFAKQ